MVVTVQVVWERRCVSDAAGGAKEGGDYYLAIRVKPSSNRYMRERRHTEYRCDQEECRKRQPDYEEEIQQMVCPSRRAEADP